MSVELGERANPLILLKQTKRYRSLILGASNVKRCTVLKSLGLEMKRGEFSNIIAKNSSGKSTSGSSRVDAAINFPVVGKTGGGYSAQPFYGLAGIPSQLHLAVARTGSDA